MCRVIHPRVGFIATIIPLVIIEKTELLWKLWLLFLSEHYQQLCLLLTSDSFSSSGAPFPATSMVISASQNLAWKFYPYNLLIKFLLGFLLVLDIFLLLCSHCHYGCLVLPLLSYYTNKKSLREGCTYRLNHTEKCQEIIYNALLLKIFTCVA